MTETERQVNFPKAATCEQMRDYFDAHCKAGRGHYFPEVRSHFLTAAPEGDTHDDDLKIVIVNGYY
jgi:hypothetical protein